MKSDFFGECRLCRQETRLKNSHIIPKFVGRWLKSTSGTGYLRAINKDLTSKRSQDLSKTPLLCEECEEKFSELETYFANNIFYPLKDGSLQSIPVDKRIGKFTISVSLRVVWVLLEAHDPIAERWKSKLIELEKEWRDYLNDEVSFEKGKNTHNILFHSKSLLGAGLSEHPNLILNLLRSSVFQIYEKFGKAYVSSHLAGVHIISMISPEKLPVSKGTQVYPDQEFGVVLPPGIGWGGYFQNVIETSRLCEMSAHDMPEGYVKMIDHSIERNQDKYLKSEDFKLLIEQDLILKKRK